MDFQQSYKTYNVLFLLEKFRKSGKPFQKIKSKQLTSEHLLSEYFSIYCNWMPL